MWSAILTHHTCTSRSCFLRLRSRCPFQSAANISPTLDTLCNARRAAVAVVQQTPVLCVNSYFATCLTFPSFVFDLIIRSFSAAFFSSANNFTFLKKCTLVRVEETSLATSSVSYCRFTSLNSMQWPTLWPTQQPQIVDQMQLSQEEVNFNQLGVEPQWQGAVEIFSTLLGR